MYHMTAKELVHVELKRNVPISADADICIMDKVLVYRERPVNKSVGPFTVLNVREKSVFVEVNGWTKQFAIDKLRLYRQEDDPEDDHDDLVNTPDQADQDDEPEWDEHGRTVDRYWNMDRALDVDGLNIFTVKIIKPTDEKAQRE